MGEYAEYALADAMARGIPIHGPRERSEPRPCALCDRGIRGDFMGMVNHLKAKHGLRDKDARKQALAKPNTEQDQD